MSGRTEGLREADASKGECAKDDGRLSELEAWMYFLTSDRPEDIARLVKECHEFEEMYLEINQFRMHPEEMMYMIEDAIRILDEGDAKLQIELLHEELDEVKAENKKKDDVIKEKDNLIEELMRQLKDLNNQ